MYNLLILTFKKQIDNEMMDINLNIILKININFKNVWFELKIISLIELKNLILI